MLIGVINLRITLTLRNEETDFFEPFQFALDITRIFFDKFGKPAYMRLEVRILGVYDYDLSANP